MTSKQKMKSTSFFKPYTGENCTLKATGTGVYLIAKKGLIVYVGMSATDVKKTLYRHFQKWTDLRTNYTKRNQAYERVTYYNENKNLFTVKVVFCKTLNEAAILEHLLIKKFKPKDNYLKNELYADLPQTKAVAEKYNNADAWKPLNEEPPF